MTCYHILRVWNPTIRWAQSPPTRRLHYSRVLGSREVNKPINKIGKVVGTMKKIEEGDFNRKWAVAEEIVLVWDIKEILHEEEP